MRQLKMGGISCITAPSPRCATWSSFNAGVPQDPTAAKAGTLSTRFTNPRGPGYPRGLGLSEAQVNDLTEFLENALYDPALVKYDPTSSTDTLQPNERDLTYSSSIRN